MIDGRIEVLDSLLLNEKITIELYDIFGDTYAVQCRLAGHPKQDGYTCSGGSWGKYDTGKCGEVPCYKVRLKKKGCQNFVNVKIDSINTIGRGW